MKILTRNEQRQIVSILADMAETFVQMSKYVPNDEFPPMCETIMEGIADVADGVGGIWAMESVSKRIRACCRLDSKGGKADEEA